MTKTKENTHSMNLYLREFYHIFYGAWVLTVKACVIYLLFSAFMGTFSWLGAAPQWLHVWFLKIAAVLAFTYILMEELVWQPRVLSQGTVRFAWQLNKYRHYTWKTGSIQLRKKQYVDIVVKGAGIVGFYFFLTKVVL